MRRTGTGLRISMRLLALATLSVTVPACSTLRAILGTGTAPPAVVQEGESSLPFCLAAKPITYSEKGDTAQTKQEIREHNAVGKTLRCKAWE